MQFAFDADLRRHITDNLHGHVIRTADLEGRRHASVAIIVTAAPDGSPSVLLTRRSPRLRGHAGQWALPGGRVDDGETIFDAAVRETSEEINLALGRADLLGRLDDYPTRSGFVMSALVFWADDAASMTPNPDEVESIHHVGLGELLRDDSPRFVEIDESPRPVIQLPVGDQLIHAPTAAVMYQFRLLGLDADPSPVNGYEQPVFAWR